MTDIPSLIERLRECIAYERTLSAPAEGSIAAMEDAIEALSLTVSPLSEEVADLNGRLRGIAHTRIAEWRRLHVNPGMEAEDLCEWEAAAALERLARENERLDDVSEALKALLEVRDNSIAEIGAQNDTLCIQNSNLYNEVQSLRADNRRLEAARDDYWKAWQNVMKERDAIKAKTIEECMDVLDCHGECRKAAIRALNQSQENPSAETE